MPSRAMRLSSVVGLRPSRSAAPLGPRTRLELQSAWRHEFLKDFYWSLNGVESFDSDPPDSQTKKNDFSLSLAVGWKF